MQNRIQDEDHIYLFLCMCFEARDARPHPRGHQSIHTLLFNMMVFWQVASLTKEVEGLRGELASAQEQGSRASAANADAARALEAVQEELDKERRENRDRDKELAEAQARGKEAEDARTQ